MPTDFALELAVGLEREKAALERRVLGLLLARRRTARPIATAAGLRVGHFGQDDHRLIFAAWLVACEHDLPLIELLKLARRALQSEGLWDEAAPAGSTGMRHSDATLAGLATPFGNDFRADVAHVVARHVVALVEAAEALGVPS